MTSEEIMALIAAFVEHRFSHPPHDVTVFLAMQAAVQLVVAERDDARAELDAMTVERDELQAERDERDAECHGIEASERYALKADIRRAVDERDWAQEDYERLTRMRARSTRDRYDF